MCSACISPFPPSPRPLKCTRDGVQCTSLTAAKLVHRARYKTPLEPVPRETGLNPLVSRLLTARVFVGDTYGRGKEGERKFAKESTGSLTPRYSPQSRVVSNQKRYSERIRPGGGPSSGRNDLLILGSGDRRKHRRSKVL